MPKNQVEAEYVMYANDIKNRAIDIDCSYSKIKSEQQCLHVFLEHAGGEGAALFRGQYIYLCMTNALGWGAVGLW